MYLFRQSNSVYYTRVAIPTSLQKNGFPKEIRLSLVTRARRMAYKRNLDQTKIIFELFELAQIKSLPFPNFKQKLNAEINKLRVSFNKETSDGDSTVVCSRKRMSPSQRNHPSSNGIERLAPRLRINP
ncbi:DUF6538 domain-containing protein [Vibrio vulnificus]|uniref:DUF6538 domain-containing protein n=1 Tax=Vibrio vulnificus TaxID=672 RepID=UPI0032EF26BB